MPFCLAWQERMQLSLPDIKSAKNHAARKLKLCHSKDANEIGAMHIYCHSRDQ